MGQWPTAFQAAEIWGIGYDTVCERMSKGDIASYITIGIYRILHPQKALAEYNEYLARQSELMPMRLRETIIVEELERLALADLRPLWEKVKEITGAEEDEIIAAEDEAEQLRICLQRHLRSWLRVSAFAERLAAGTDAVFFRIR